MLTGYDAAFPPASPPPTDVVAFYIGGDTPHVWTAEEIAAQKARYRLPIWVRSNPQNVIVENDVTACVAALKAIGAPRGTCVVLDLETAVAVDYCNAFGWELNANGYSVLPYGSPSTLFKNPRLDGYWVAGQPSAPSPWPPGLIGVQLLQQGPNGAWDNDLFVDTLSLWDTHQIATGGTDVPAPTDVVDSFSVPGTDGSQYFDLHADGGLFAYGGADDTQLEYVASANDGSRYHFGPAQTPGVISYPGLPASARSGTRYFVAMSVLSYRGQPVGVGSPGPTGATGPQGPPGPAGAPAPTGTPIDLASLKAGLTEAANAVP